LSNWFWKPWFFLYKGSRGFLCFFGKDIKWIVLRNSHEVLEWHR
jgi:hypothetical protein